MPDALHQTCLRISSHRQTPSNSVWCKMNDWIVYAKKKKIKIVISELSLEFYKKEEVEKCTKFMKTIRYKSNIYKKYLEKLILSTYNIFRICFTFWGSFCIKFWIKVFFIRQNVIVYIIFFFNKRERNSRK